jgi:hypothetical protein
VLVLPAGTTESAEAGELASEVLLKPAADLAAELLVLGSQSHRALRLTDPEHAALGATYLL